MEFETVMTPQANVLACDGHLLKRLVEAGLVWLEVNQERVNQLNVFPVPDGDTGTNMYLTMRKAYEAVADLDDAHVGQMCAALARGALVGARGNSGVILSQWWRGFAQALENEPVLDASLFARACRSAVEMAYRAVIRPVEGTILTVTRQAMEAVAELAPREPNLLALFEAKVAMGYDALRHTPDLLPVLKEAGVVDSGGQGWIFIIEGMLRLMRGEDIHLRSAAAVAVQRPGWEMALQPEDEQGYGYDVQFLMRGQGFDVAAVQAAISEIGWSVLVVGDDNLIKVHVHVHDPGAPLSYAIRLGAVLDDVVIENMQLQYERYVQERHRHEARPVDGVAVIAVAAGEGLRRLFLQDLGAASVVSGGQTMNPSTEDFLATIQSLPNTEIILLPNNPNITMAAEQAAALCADKRVRVVPTRSIPQGISAMFAYLNDRDSLSQPELVEAMAAAARMVRTAEVTTATRAARLNGMTVGAGQIIGLLDDRLAAAGSSVEAVVRDLLRQMGTDKYELVTLYYGIDVTQAEAESLSQALRAEFDAVEIHLVSGGQPLYLYIIGVE